MKRLLGIVCLAVACAPNYKSGVTECSDGFECPDGYYCAEDWKCYKGTAPVVKATGGTVVATGGSVIPTGGTLLSATGGVPGSGGVTVKADAAPTDLPRDAGAGSDLARDAIALPMDTRPADSGTDAPAALSNANSLLSGGALGLGTTATSSLVRTVSIALTGAGFESSVAYLARTTVGSTYSLITIPVKNTGTTLACFVYATFKVFGSSGALLATFTPLVTGSVGYGGDPTVYTDTCLQPGESGFLLDFDDLQLDLFTNARSATLTITADKTAAYRLSSSVVQATAFVNSVSTGIETITVKNIGTVTANLSAVGSTVILLDANYYPLYWDFLYPQAGSEVLEPGELGYLTDDATLRNFGAGSAPIQLVHVSFEGTLASALVSDGSAAGVARQKRAALRARRLPGQ